MHELISIGRFESTNLHLLRKSIFLFGDAIEENEEVLFDGNYKWLRQIGENLFFLPNMERMFPLSYLQSVSLLRYMYQDIVRVQSGIAIRRVSNRAAFPTGHNRENLALFSRSIKQEFPTGETPMQATTFISRFMEVNGKFPQSD